MKPIKITQAIVTRWLTHEELCSRVISRFESLIDPLDADAIYFQRKDVEAKVVRSLLPEPDMIRMLVLLGDVLARISIYFLTFF